MRHNASMIAAMEGVNRPVFQIAKELSQNSRSGLTVRFLAKKLELPQEEIEYLVDVNHSLLFTDLTKIKLPAEGVSAVKRINDGLECLGDVPALFRKIKSLSPHDFRRIEEFLDLDRPVSKKAIGEEMIERVYKHPESVVEYVAAHGFSPIAREVFDILWQSKKGIMPVPKIRAAHGGSEYEVEQALWELFRGVALFEMFRFDGADRLVRSAGLISELRQWREEHSTKKPKKKTLKGVRTTPGSVESHGTSFTDTICQLVAAIGAKPVRLRGDGELFREDLRRLSDVVPEEAEPSLTTCLWAAEGIGWLVRVDNELRAGELEVLIDVDHFDRHRMLFNWMMSTGNEGVSRRLLTDLLDTIKPNAWYSTTEFVGTAMHAHEKQDRAILKPMGGHYAYLSPSVASSADKSLARSLEESLFWLGVVERSSNGYDSFFGVSELGRCLLTEEGVKEIKKKYKKQSTEIVVQPNFDIVVPTQDMDSLLTVPLDQFALRQSTGAATVYLLSKESFTQGLQDGHDGDAFVDYLLHHNRGGSLPANVMTTLDDWRGGLRRVHVKTYHVIESDDPLVMADLQHRRKFKNYLSDIDPRKVVVYKKISKAELAKLLEKEGFIVE